MRSSRRELLAFALVASVAASLSAAPIVAAEPTPDERARATALFERGRDELARGALEQACASFAESQRLDPAGGTLLNLALCHERRGRLATASREFREALALARRDDKKSRVEAAEAHLAALAPRIPRLVVRVRDDARAAGLALTLDGAAIPPSTWGAPVEVDPGDHTLRATAPSRRTREIPVTLAEGSGVTTVELAPLEPDVAPAPAASPAPAAPSPPPAGPAPAATGRAPAVGWASLGIGAASLAVGGVLGARAISARGDVERGCPDLSRCTPALAQKNDRAVRDADLSTAAFALGAVAGTFGALWLWGPGSSRGGHAWVAPVVAASPGVAAGGAF
ncbi:MAG: tetratricopeptide repeat protein [Polyangiaceae bacterium]|nr:tetratricopeptide repeat protein [Polyangiaceae bacterium]